MSTVQPTEFKPRPIPVGVWGVDPATADGELTVRVASLDAPHLNTEIDLIREA